MQVEQEIEADDVDVIDHVLDCDVERNELLKEFNELTGDEGEEGAQGKANKLKVKLSAERI